MNAQDHLANAGTKSVQGRDDGGPAFPPHAASTATEYMGMTLRDYAAIHATQPGRSEICSMKGLRYDTGSVWSDEQTRIGYFEGWWESMPLEERLELSARVRYAEADAMLKARK